MIRIVGLLVCFLFAQVVFAANNDMVVGTLIGSDTGPPTIPNNVSLTPVATTQIDIHWDASTDDQILSGYNVFRDNVAIATTSLTTYSDTDRTPGTTYAYTVRAYDSLFNYSPFSTSTATSTPQAQRDGSSTGSLLSPKLVGLEITTTEQSVTLDWKTNVYVRYVFKWGRSSAHELGFVQSDTYKREHTTYIDNLEPGTIYTYQLIVYNQQNKAYLLKEDTFTTATPADRQAPANVSHLRARVKGDAVQLFWVNPTDADLSKIRIVRNNNFYPRDISNGYIVYEGTGEHYTDGDAFRVYGVQYYSIFSYDTTGNISSGAVIAVYKNDGRKNETNTNTTIETSSHRSKDTIGTSSDSVGYERLSVNFADVRVLQNNTRIDSIDGNLVVRSGVPVVLQIPYELLPEHLKTILVTIEGTQIEPVSYMLRVNKDKSFYQAVIPPLVGAGEETLLFSIYDYKTELLSSFTGTLIVVEKYSAIQLTKQVLASSFGIRMTITMFVFVLLLFFYILLVRKGSHEDKYPV